MQTNGNEDETHLPESCYCPITNELMSDPCIVDGKCCHTISREAVLQWFEVSRQRVCPVCGIRLRSRGLTPNTVAKDLVAMYEYMSVQNKYRDANDTSSGEKIASKKKKKFKGGRFGNMFRRSVLAQNEENLEKGSEDTSTELDWSMFTDERVMSEILKVEKIADIVQIMLNRPLNSAIQGRACHRIIDLAQSLYVEDGRKNDHRYKLLCDSGAIKLIIVALRNFLDSAELTKCACWALYTLSYDNDTAVREEIVKHDAVRILMNAAKSHLKNENILASTFACLRNLSYRNSTVKKSLVNTGIGILELSNNSICLHFGSDYVLENICEFLLDLFDDNRQLDYERRSDIFATLNLLCEKRPNSRSAHLATCILIDIGMNFNTPTSTSSFMKNGDNETNKGDEELFQLAQTKIAGIFREVVTTTGLISK